MLAFLPYLIIAVVTTLMAFFTRSPVVTVLTLLILLTTAGVIDKETREAVNEASNQQVRLAGS